MISYIFVFIFNKNIILEKKLYIMKKYIMEKLKLNICIYYFQ